MRKMVLSAFVLLSSLHAAAPVEGLDDDRLLFEFYSKEVAKLDSMTLQRYPELVFRRAMVGLHLLDEETSMMKLQEELFLLRHDLQFVMYYADSTSKLFKAAKLHVDLIDSILKGNPSDFDQLIQLTFSFSDQYLQQFATLPGLLGKQLREDVFMQINHSEKIAEGFFNFLLLKAGEPDLSLGIVIPEDIRVKGIVPQKDGSATLLCEITYTIQTLGACKKVVLEINL